MVLRALVVVLTFELGFTARVAFEGFGDPTTPALAYAQEDPYDCSDFDTQAQAVYNQETSDPYGLDGPSRAASEGEPGPRRAG
jgi:hypothetical protein